jgi:hypothetical protein
VSAVVILTDALTQLALIAVTGTKVMEFALSATSECEALSDDEAQEDDSGIIVVSGAHEALNAYDALNEDEAHDALSTVTVTSGAQLADTAQLLVMLYAFPSTKSGW